MQQEKLNVGKVTLEVTIVGTGPLVVLCHGNSSASSTFRLLLASGLSSRFRFASVSLPGHGVSGWAGGRSGYSLPSLREALLAAVRQLSERPILCGHSLGGHLMSQIATRVEGIRGLALVSAPPLDPSALSKTFRPDPTSGAMFSGELKRSEVVGFAESLLSRASCDATDFENLVDAIERTDPAFREGLGQSLARGELIDEVRALTELGCPLAMIGGLEDPFISPTAYDGLELANLWRGKPELLPGVGHSPHLESPGTFVGFLSAFLEHCLLVSEPVG